MQWYAVSSVLCYRSGGSCYKPLTGLTIDPEDDETDVLGKTVDELQTGVEINKNIVSGLLSYVDDYTGFSGDPAQQKGNYLVLKIDTDDPDDVITVELIGGTVGHPVELDSDRNIVLRIVDPAKQQIRVVATHTNEDETTVTDTKLLRLTGLELEDAD